MKIKLTSLIFLVVCNISIAQNTTEAKMAFQMAEEKFESKQYAQALDFLNKAETALGSVNPPMAYLKVMIVDQLASENVNNEKSKDALSNLEKALTVFDKTKGKDNLGEQKLMAIYRIKTDLEKRKEAHQQWEDNLVKQYQIFQKMIYRLASEYPKTDITVGEFVSHPMSWNAKNFFHGKSITENRINKIIKWGQLYYTSGNFIYDDLKPNQFYISYLKTDGPGINNVNYYTAEQYVRLGKKKGLNYEISRQQLINLLNIPKELHEGITWNEDTFIQAIQTANGKSYFIKYESDDQKPNGEVRKLLIKIDNEVRNFYGHEYILIRVFENTL